MTILAAPVDRAKLRPSDEGGAGRPAVTRRHQVESEEIGQRLRRAMREVATAVAVVAVRTPDRDTGMTVSSFTSISLDPPLILVSVSRDASMLRWLGVNQPWTLNVLHAEAQSAARWFSNRERHTDTTFGGHQRLTSAHVDAPILETALMTLACTTDEIVPAGDHYLVLGRVRGVDVLDGNRQPMVFFRGSLEHTATPILSTSCS